MVTWLFTYIDRSIIENDKVKFRLTLAKLTYAQVAQYMSCLVSQQMFHAKSYTINL